MCRAYQVPHSVMWCGRVPGPGEPLWLPLDAALAAAFEERRAAEAAARCQRCGTAPEDWQAEDGSPLPVPGWVVETFDCPGCLALDHHQAGEGDNPPRHRHTRLRPATWAEGPDATVDAPAPDPDAAVWMIHVSGERAPITLTEFTAGGHAGNGWRLEFDEATGNPRRVDASPPRVR